MFKTAFFRNFFIRIGQSLTDSQDFFFVNIDIYFIQENTKEDRLTADEITARLNEIYRDNPVIMDDDIMLAQYNLVGDGDW